MRSRQHEKLVMKAARLHTFGAGFVIEEVPTPVPGPGQVLIRIAGAGACHSDLHIASGDTQGVALPHTLGQENAAGRGVRPRR
jgi:propanol-preferring alcohol dehydrogenase